MVKQAKTKTRAKKGGAAKQPHRSAASTRRVSKYDQSGAPWWKRTALPTPK